MTPEPPYWVVIFTSRRTGADADDGYAEMADAMDRLARAAPGYLGHESVRDTDGFGVTLSYWTSEAAIRAWKADIRHLAAQRRGGHWYEGYEVRIAQVSRAYSGPAGRTP